ncbi:unnamed protein product [Miscanthus lutarioriparius]|uniref:Uncharacterized protein n=2 Tax=Miscanthus TaxID=62336 RepID=A0A811PYR5_9POAL|nr:unnamed protein product [Miscanthus lutarioriparius]
MPPARKLAASRRQPAESPATECERVRAETIMRNNREFQSLGINATKDILNKTTAAKKAMARENSGSLYDPGDNDGSEEGVVDKVSQNVPCDTIVANGGARGQSNHTIDRWNKGKSMGRDLDRISRGLNTRIPVVIAEGKKRPEPPMQAAKLASEGGIILRQHIPIFTHWKEYKDIKNKDILPGYMGKISNQLAIDTDSKPVKEACADLLRTGTRQMRYNLKKLYFNGVPADKVRTTSPLKSMTDDQWRELVEMWSSPKHKDKCAKNALNREKVRFHQMTGSRCYIATTHALKQEKYKDEPPSAIDLFKALHCSSKTGFNESAKEAIAEMESIAAAPVEDGQVVKTPAEVVAQVLPKSKFLQNIGLQLAAPKRSSKAINDARVIELEAEVAAGKQDKEELKDEMETLKKKVEESENERRRLLEETEQLKKAQDELKKAQDETNAFFRRMFSKE